MSEADHPDLVRIPARDLVPGRLIERAVRPAEPWRTVLVTVREVRKGRDATGAYYRVFLAGDTVTPRAFTLRSRDSVRGLPE